MVRETPFIQKARALTDKFERLEARLEVRHGGGPYFDGERFSLVDAVFGPVFRYFDVFDRIGEFGILAGKPNTLAYRQALSVRPSVRAAVASDYNSRLWTFLQARKSHLSRIMAVVSETRLGATNTAGADSAAAIPPKLAMKAY
jgi:glutathione S-transferase